MLRWLFDLFFTRRVWTLLESYPYKNRWDGESHVDGIVYILQDQFGNLKFRYVEGERNA